MSHLHTRAATHFGFVLALFVGLIQVPSSVFAQEPEQLAEQAADLAVPAVEQTKETVQAVLSGDLAAVEQLFRKYLVPAALTLLGLIVGYMIASFIGQAVGSVVSERVDLTLGKFLGRMTSNGLLLLIALGLLGSVGVETSGLAAVLAAGGFAVGLALQGTLSNFAAGVMLLVFRPFKVEDFISVSKSVGTVEEIDLFTTRINTTDNRHLIVPNSQIFGSTIENFTRNSVRRVDVNVGVAYSADLRRTRQVLTDAVSMIPGAVREPVPQAYLMELGDSSVNWQMRVWCRPESYWDVRERVTAAAKDALDANGIEIPFPQLDVHVPTSAAMLKVA